MNFLSVRVFFTKASSFRASARGVLIFASLKLEICFKLEPGSKCLFSLQQFINFKERFELQRRAFSVFTAALSPWWIFRDDPTDSSLFIAKTETGNCARRTWWTKNWMESELKTAVRIEILNNVRPWGRVRNTPERAWQEAASATRLMLQRALGAAPGVSVHQDVTLLSERSQRLRRAGAEILLRALNGWNPFGSGVRLCCTWQRVRTFWEISR